MFCKLKYSNFEFVCFGSQSQSINIGIDVNDDIYANIETLIQ